MEDKLTMSINEKINGVIDVIRSYLLSYDSKTGMALTIFHNDLLNRLDMLYDADISNQDSTKL